MPPIPVHIDEPITPSKASAITPQTEPTRTTTTDVSITTPASGGGYPAAQPGAAAVPASTPFAAPHYTPTRTTQGGAANENNHPPAPQPGAVPVPPTHTITSSLPPPPTASGAPPPPKPGSAFSATPAATPSQMNVPPLTQNYAPTHSTTTSVQPSAPARSGPTTLNLGPVGTATPSAPPGGYTQNAYAQDMSSAQRASLDAAEAEERRGSVWASLGGTGQGGGFGSSGGGQGGGSGGLGGSVRDGSGEDVVGNAWSAVKGWVGAAGSKLAEGEGEVWRRINGGK